MSDLSDLPDLPDRLRPLEPDLKRHSLLLTYTDWQRLKQGQCRAVAAGLRRRGRLAHWIAVPALVVGTAYEAWRFVDRFVSVRDAGTWLTLLPLVLLGAMLLSFHLSRRRVLDFAARLDALGDG